MSDATHWLEILRHNHGFSEPQAWIDFAREHRFTRVAATPVERCRECGSPERSEVGQFVHYSTLIRLQHCLACDLIYADAHVDPSVISGHFEQAYKDDAYFTRRRRAIFAAIVERVDACTKLGGRVIDVGGAQGHLLAALRERRPDLDLTLNDLSANACEHASARYGLRTHCGTLASLSRSVERDEPYDTALMIDVIYYEPDIAGLWAAVDGIVAPGGCLILRLPNTYPLMLLSSRLERRLHPQRARMRADQRFFNQEHIFVFTRSYLRERLRKLGFGTVDFLPSPLLGAEQARGSPWPGWLYALSRVVRGVTGGRLVATPSMFVVARRG